MSSEEKHSASPPSLLAGSPSHPHHPSSPPPPPSPPSLPPVRRAGRGRQRGPHRRRPCRHGREEASGSAPAFRAAATAWVHLRTPAMQRAARRDAPGAPATACQVAGWLEKRELEASKRYLSWRGNRSALVAPAQAAVLATSTKRARRPSSRERSGVRYAADAPAASDKAEGGGGADDMVVSDATPRADEGPS